MILKDIIKSLLPDTFTDNKVSNDVFDILLDYIETNNNISYNISNIYNNIHIIPELIKIYLENLNSSFIKAETNQDIINALERYLLQFNTSTIETSRIITYTAPEVQVELGTESGELIISETTNDTFSVYHSTSSSLSLTHLIAQNGDFLLSSKTVYSQLDMNYFNILETFLNEEYIYTSKAFKQKKGTRVGLQYAYNIFRQSGIQRDGFTGTADPKYKLVDHNIVSFMYSSSIRGIDKITIPNNYSSISFVLVNNNTHIPRDIKLILNHTYTNLSGSQNISFGYRLNSTIDPLEITGSNIVVSNITRGVSGSITSTYTNELNVLTTVTITIDGTYSAILSNPFTYYLEGSLLPEIYENSIKDVIHPVGYDYTYIQK
jgi:hypothetical protein